MSELKVADYKGYEIRLDGFRRFEALKDGKTVYREDAYSKLTEKLDKVVKAETKISPIPVIIPNGYNAGEYITGKITSFNNEEQSAWFVSDKGRREKCSHYTAIYKANEANLAIAARIRQLTIEKEALEVKISSAKYEFTDRLEIGEIVINDNH